MAAPPGQSGCAISPEALRQHLGVHTDADFQPQRHAKCYRASMFWRGHMRTITIGLCLALLSATDALAGRTAVLAQAGNWQTYFTINDQRVPICGISQFAGPYGFLIKYFGDTDTSSIQVTKTSWNIPSGVQVYVSLEIDGQPVFRGRFSQISPTMLDAAFSTGKELFQLLNLFSAGQKMAIVFLEGNEGRWGGGLTGSRVVTERFEKCIIDLYTAQHPQATQPYEQSGPTQPYQQLPPTPSVSNTQPYRL
jgi:hypothetical protein